MGIRGPKPRREGIVWNADFAYAVGLIASDGNLSPDGRHFVFVSKELEQIVNIKKCLGITANANHKASGTKGNPNLYYRLQWGDVTLYNFMLSIGLTPNKSRTIGALAIPDEFFFDFFRGHLDGDGCFYSYFDPRWKHSFMFYLTIVSGSKEHIDWLRETVNRLVGVRGHITSNKKHPHILQLKYAKTESIILLQQLYRRPKATCLSRKKLKIEAALGIVGESLPKS